MQRLTRFAVLMLACCSYFFTTAQTTACTADFSYTISHNTVYFYAKDSAGSHHWVFGDGSAMVVGQYPSIGHTYNHPGQYEVKHFIEKPNNSCRDSIVKVIVIPNVDSSCHADFDWELLTDSTPGTSPFIYRFHDRSQVSGNIISYKWTFGDGSATSGINNPLHTYIQPGTYQVCLSIETSTGCSSQLCKQLVVVQNNPCNIAPQFNWKADSSNPNKVFFHNLTLSTVAAIHYTWNFGDNSTSGDINPTHTYNQGGTYHVCLVAEISNTCRKEYCTDITIKQCDIKARYEWKHDATNSNTIWFQNISQPVNQIWRTYWSYGDGSTSQDFNSYHKYDHPGVYNVCLKVISLNGCTDSFCDSLHVAPPQDSCNHRAAFVYHSGAPVTPLSFKFVAQYQSSTARYYWNFGDGSTAEGANVYHNYQHRDKYNVCLTVKDGGCIGTHCEQVTAGVNCDSIFVKYEYIRQPNHSNEIRFVAGSNEPLIAQTWYIYKTSNTATPVAVLQQNNPTYVFHDTGSYVVCLKAVTASLCSKEYCNRIVIDRVENGRIGLSPNPATSTVTIDVTLTRPEQVSIRIMDGSGTIRDEFVKSGATGNNRFTLPVERLNQGIYLVEIKTGSQKWVTRFQKG